MWGADLERMTLDEAGLRCEQLGPDGHLLADGNVGVWVGCEGDALVIGCADGSVLFGVFDEL